MSQFVTFHCFQLPPRKGQNFSSWNGTRFAVDEECHFRGTQDPSEDEKETAKRRKSTTSLRSFSSVGNHEPPQTGTQQAMFTIAAVHHESTFTTETCCDAQPEVALRRMRASAEGRELNAGVGCCSRPSASSGRSEGLSPSVMRLKIRAAL